MAHDLAQTGEQLIVRSAEGNVSVGAPNSLVRCHHPMRRPHRLWHAGTGKIFRRFPCRQSNPGLDEGRINILSLPAAGAVEQRGENASCGEQRGA